MFRRKYSRRYPLRRRKYARRSRYAKKKLGLRAMVKKIMNRKLETKLTTYTVGNAGIYDQNSSALLQSNTFQLLPVVAQGAQDGARIGDRISVTSLKVKALLNLATTSMSQRSLYVRVVIFSTKDYNADVTGGTCPSIELSNFFRNQTTTSSVTGYMYNDQLLPINTNRLTVHFDRRYILGSNITGTTSANNYPNASPVHEGFKHIEFNIKNIKRLVYDENGTNPNLPTNHDLWMAVIPNNVDSVVNTGTTNPVFLSFCSILSYKDG